jgi:hypothetical protein
MAIYLDGVFGFNVVQTLVVDIVIRVTRVGGIRVELGLEIGRESQTVGVCERLENLNEKNIVLSQNFQCLCIQYRRLAIPYIEAGESHRQYNPVV